ncbi:related to Transcription elongation factor S-II [Saccharomycodes ludwigii]|uniref:Transcription elongation factor n=1 Tax=Saccharomycodes ludwigii TaxID=36035 RepID=A0A376B1M3_9ASCO|nr:hypothetical protein SCDLUD_001442 [Saccharomycodes ludwigii]KAH3901672.1 hypothetical protein SCDLUD_001442 [Saccharomycodes ludwigii]SSD58563.1 related to Transcription elongation factor S-II [Saccharomycodes ludwigii]
MLETKEVLTLVKNLEKAKTNDEEVLKILKILEKDMKPTEKLLRETKVGVAVNQFKKSTNQEVSKVSKKIINDWKTEISKEKKKNKLNASSNKSSSSLNNSNTKKNIITELPDKPRSSKLDNVNTQVHNEKLRDMVIKAFYDALCKETRKSSNEILDLCINIENELNVYANNDEKKYKDKYRVIFSSVISKTNKELKVKILTGDCTPNYLVNCDPKDLAPEHLQKKLQEIKEKNLYNAQGATVERSVTDRFQCGKCKERKVSYYQLQTRSADEPLTTFCTCENCGNRWKFS